MKFVISVVILFGLGLGAWQLYQAWENVQPSPPVRASAAVPPPPSAPPSGSDLPGLPPRLQAACDAAQQRGAFGLHDFLIAHAGEVADPRLASIQLDYVLLVTPTDPAEARRVFAQVKERLQPGSPVYTRMEQMAATYQ